jgi:hypothetical protein
MKQLLKLSSASALTIIGLAIPLTAMARGSNYQSDLTTVLTTPVSVKVRLSDDLIHRADNLPEKLSDRGSGSSLSSGFSSNGFYGENSLERLRQDLSEDMTQRLQKEGLQVAENAPAKLVLTIENVKNNRPTFNQLSREPGLSLESFGIGGAEIKGELFDSAGASLGTMDYRYYSSNIRDAKYSAGTWTDTKRAFGRFSRKAAQDLAE